MNEHNQKQAVKESVKEAEDAVEHTLMDIPHDIYEMFRNRRRSAFEKHPLLFSMLGFIGGVITWQGVVGMIREIPILAENPHWLFVIGGLILVLTGALYRQLDEK